MNQVIVGVFASYRDGHEALRALQLAGLKRDDAHLYRAGHADTMPSTMTLRTPWKRIARTMPNMRRTANIRA